MTTDQVRDEFLFLYNDDYREPHLEEGVLVIQEDNVWTIPTYSSNRFADEPREVTFHHSKGYQLHDERPPFAT